jgi:hypothetical protein
MCLITCGNRFTSKVITIDIDLHQKLKIHIERYCHRNRSNIEGIAIRSWLEQLKGGNEGL